MSDLTVAGGLRLHYLEWGDPAGRPVLLLHGSLGQAGVWTDVATRIDGPYRLIALDLRGHGDSDRPAPPRYGFDDYATDVRAFVAAAGLSRPVIIGHSMGALIALRLAGAGELPVAGVGVIDIEANPPLHQVQFLNAAGDRPVRQFDSLAAAIAAEQRGLPDVPLDRVQRLLSRGFRVLPDGQVEPTADPEALRQFEPIDCRADLKRIACPVLIVRGALSTVMRRWAADQMAGSARAGSLVEIPGAGHQLLIEQPAAVAAAIAGWLGRIAASAAT